jgi:hypothetical protein
MNTQIKLNTSDIERLFTEVHNGNIFYASFKGRDKMFIDNGYRTRHYDEHEEFCFTLDDDNIIKSYKDRWLQPKIGTKNYIIDQVLSGVKLAKTSTILKTEFNNIVDKLKNELKMAGIHIPTYEERIDRTIKFDKIEKEREMKFKTERCELLYQELWGPQVYHEPKKQPYYDPKDSY